MTATIDSEDAAGDLTLRVLQYREAARHVWNTSLRDDADPVGTVPDGFVLDRWEVIRDHLFAALVLRYTGEATPEVVHLGNGDPLRFLRVVATSPTIPAHVSRAKPAQTYWDNPINRLSPTDDLRFIDFFDWSQSGYLDFKYFRVFIQASEAHPELAGHEALVEVQYAKVFLDEDVAHGDTP